MHTIRARTAPATARPRAPPRTTRGHIPHHQTRACAPPFATSRRDATARIIPDVPRAANLASHPRARFDPHRIARVRDTATARTHATKKRLRRRTSGVRVWVRCVCVRRRRASKRDCVAHRDASTTLEVRRLRPTTRGSVYGRDWSIERRVSVPVPTSRF